ncbi:MAG: hypothetical protein ACM3H8_04205, partial [Sphingobacteriales bacterium]
KYLQVNWHQLINNRCLLILFILPQQSLRDIFFCKLTKIIYLINIVSEIYPIKKTVNAYSTGYPKQ